MKQSDYAAMFPEAWGASADAQYMQFPIPASTDAAGRASLDLGFPPATMTPPEAGGSYPFGADVNGGFRMCSTSARNYESGVIPPWSASFAQAINGYPKGAMVADATTLGLFWISEVDDNLTAPGASDTSWVNLFSNLVANGGGNKGGITTAAVDGTTGTPTFRDGNGNWHIVQPAGNYLETDEADRQNVAGPVYFAQNPTGTTAAFGASNKSFATTEFASRLNSGRLRAVNTFPSTGTYTPPRADPTLVFRIRMVGAGGGGASSVPQDAYACSAGGGGTAGSYTEVWLTYSQLFSGATNTSLQVIIGSGGSANANGGQSSIGNAVICPGGYGAPNVNAGGYSTISPSSPFSASPNYPNGILFFVAAIPGQCGSPGNVVNPQYGANFFALSGAGASSPMGVGGYAVGNGQDGIQGGPGGGGSGACGSRATSGTSAGQTGGTGGNGAAIIECYEAI